MTKKWERVECDFNHKTFVEVSFINNNDDFSMTRYPNIEKAIEIQTYKLERDVKSSVGANGNIKPLMKFLLS